MIMRLLLASLAVLTDAAAFSLALSGPIERVSAAHHLHVSLLPTMSIQEANAALEEEPSLMDRFTDSIGLLFTGLGPQYELPEEELKAIFYQADADLSGEIDRVELANALYTVGFRIRQAEYEMTFNEIDADSSGVIDFEEFKEFMSKTKRKVRSQKFAMDLFRRFDVNEGGSIDKFEFAALAEEIENQYKRRNVLVGFAAAAGALVIDKYDFEYAFAQKKLRGLYIEPKAEEAQNKLFPTAMLSSDLDAAIARTLGERGFTAANTLFGHSVCSDEVNNKNEQLVALMVSRWQEGFSLGGLGGLPFAGKSGFRAFLHHSPDSGKLLVLFAPHVGIDVEGRVGALQRDGQSAISKACGAAVGAYKAIQSKGNLQAPVSSVREIVDTANNPFDPELGTIIDLLTPRLEGIEESAEPITFVTYQMYTIVRDLLDNCIKETDDVWEWVTEVAVVGGIMINRHTGGDFFQPLTFELCTKGAAPQDLFVQAFGPRPELLPVLGSEKAVQAIIEGKRR